MTRLARYVLAVLLLPIMPASRLCHAADTPHHSVAPIDARQIRALLGNGTNAVTLLHFWATWCPPCVEEFPNIVALAKKYQGCGLRVLLVSADADNDIAAVAGFLAAHRVDWQTYQAVNINDTFVKAISTNWSGAIPASFFCAPDGTIAEWWEGARPFSKHEQTVLRLLGKQQKGDGGS